MQLVLLTALGVGGATVIGALLGFIFKNSLSSGVFAMLGGLIIVPLVSFITQKHAPDGTDKLFECYKVTHPVPAKSSLSED
jgi:SSS family solute:Na+ symporter